MHPQKLPVDDLDTEERPRPVEAPQDEPENAARPEHLSGLLLRLQRGTTGPISVRQLAEALDERSFGAFLVVFAMPNLVPLPPGATLVLGLPLVFIGWQMAIGRSKMWMPRRVADFMIERHQLDAMINRVVPWLRWLETFVRPRHWPLDNPVLERMFSIFVLVLAIAIVLPIPFGNWLPAFAIGLLGIAWTERDGISLALGALVGLASCAIVGLVLAAAAALVSTVV